MPRLKNPNHEKFAQVAVKELINNEGKFIATKAYKTVYKDAQPNSAATAGPRLLQNVEVQSRIQEIVLSKNSPDEISADLAVLRRANKEIFDPKGNIVEVIDNSTRLGAVNTVLKVIGAFNDPDGGDKHVHFHMSNEAVDRLKQACDAMQAITQRLQLNHDDAA